QDVLVPPPIACKDIIQENLVHEVNVTERCYSEVDVDRVDLLKYPGLHNIEHHFASIEPGFIAAAQFRNDSSKRTVFSRQSKLSGELRCPFGGLDNQFFLQDKLFSVMGQMRQG
ncbi:hypothetical protein OS493_035878, partial [Desmophyllum pertusum]